jgi:hypothetical protein
MRDNNKIFKNGYVYKIFSKNTDKIYIGSTVQSLKKRLYEHECLITSLKPTCSSYLILECGDYKIELIEELHLITLRELREKESENILKYRNICVNIGNPALLCLVKEQKQENISVEKFLQNEAKARSNIDEQMSESVDSIFKNEIKEMRKKAKKCKDNIAIIGLLKTIDRCF